MIKASELKEVLFKLNGGDFITIILETSEPDFRIPDYAIKESNLLYLNTTDFDDSQRSTMYAKKLKELQEHIDEETEKELDKICDAYASLF